MDLQELSDRIEIQAALTRYATGVDSRDWELWQTVFTSDADVDYTSSLPLRGTRTERRAVLIGHAEHDGVGAPGIGAVDDPVDHQAASDLASWRRGRFFQLPL